MGAPGFGRQYVGWSWVVLWVVLVGAVFWFFLPGGCDKIPRPRKPGGTRIPMIKVWRPDAGQTTSMDLETYVFGVVAAEMPASFEIEALKAQAVAARTVAVRALEDKTAGRRDLPFGADVSADHRTDQAWLPAEDLAGRWGVWRYLVDSRKIRAAVDATRGQIVTYAGKPIVAAYHSTSGGRTEASQNYWSERLPYLQSRPSPYETHSPYFLTTVQMNAAEVISRLFGGENCAGKTVSMSVTERYETGRVKRVTVNGNFFTGRQIREKLGLRSSWFDVTVSGDTLIFTVRGNGHGIGMSQYGADGMAREGYNYEQILMHFYPGTRLTRLY